MKKLIALALLSGTAGAQVDNLNLNMGAYQFSGEVSPTVNVTGSGFDFTAGGAGYLIDLEGAPSLQAAGSYVETLQYYLDGTTITGALLNIDNNSSGMASCGSVPGFSPAPYSHVSACVGSVVDPPSAPANAPEIDGKGAVGAFTLLAGLVLVLKSRAPR
jgi:hypothetical protein